MAEVGVGGEGGIGDRGCEWREKTMIRVIDDVCVTLRKRRKFFFQLKEAYLAMDNGVVPLLFRFA